MTTYTLPAFVITADTNSIPDDAFTSEMVIVAPVSAPSFSYDVIRTENFDGLGDSHVISLNQTVISKTVADGSIEVPQTNYHAIFEVTWGEGSRSIVMIASADPMTRIGIVIDGDPFPQIDSLEDYYDWVASFSSLEPVTSGDYAAGEQIAFADLPGVTLSESTLTTGGPDDDILEGGPDDDAFDGGDGIDTAVFEGAQSNYTLEISSSGLILEDRRVDGQGRDTLANVEFLDFGTEIPALGDAPMRVDMFDSGVDIAPEDFRQIVELYIAYFDRAPDALGLLFWANSYAEGLSLEAMAADFAGQPETQAKYPAETTNEEFVNTIYANLFGRAPDADGFTFWVGQLDAGATREGFILSVLQGARSDLDPSFGQEAIDQQLADREYLDNKTDIGTYFAITRGMSDVQNAATVMDAFDGSEDSITTAVTAADDFFDVAQGAADDGGEFLIPLIGVLDSPF